MLAAVISGGDVSSSWLACIEHLADCRGASDVNVCVAIEDPLGEDSGIRRALDTFIEQERARRNKNRPSPVATVANTIFPRALYGPGQGASARERLYELHARAYGVERRIVANRYGTYFGRLTAYPMGNGETFNQLEQVVQRLQVTLAKGRRSCNSIELAAGGPPADGGLVGDLRVRVPGRDNRVAGFPCLSHVSLSLDSGRLHVAALYRNQYFVSRAYGNFLGLGWLQAFIARESGCQVGELLCVASHADGELARRALRALAGTCRSETSSGAAVRG